MRRHIFAFVATIVMAANLSACGRMALDNAKTSVTSCTEEAKASPMGVIVYKRLWAADDTDTADKLSDTKPLSKEERDALVHYRKKILPCRQIIIAHNNQFAPWATPYSQEAFQRQDTIFYKLAGGEMTVGVANKLTIDNLNKLQADIAGGQAAQSQQATAAVASGLAAGLVRAGQIYSPPPPQATNAPPPAEAAPIIPSCAMGYRCNGRLQQADGVWR